MSLAEICVIFAEPTYYLEEQVQALKNLEDPDFQVLYVPDANLPESYQQRLNLDSRFRVIPSGIASIPVKRNFCLKNIRPETEWAVFVDDDAYPPPAWMENLKACIRKNPSVKILGGPSLPPPHAGLREKAVGLAVESAIGLGKRSKWSRPISRPMEIEELRTCNLAIHRSVLDLPDSHFNEKLAIGEDMDWCHRMRTAHRQSIWIFPELYIYNHSRPLFYPAYLQFFRYGSYRTKILIQQGHVFTSEALTVLAPIGFMLLPFAAIFAFRPAAVLLAVYLLSIFFEGLALGKSFREHLLRLFSIPFVHLSYALGALSRLIHPGRGDTQTYVRPETVKIK